MTIRGFEGKSPGQVSNIRVAEFKIRVATFQIRGAELQIRVASFLSIPRLMEVQIDH
jgi:hypothetical protein